MSTRAPWRGIRLLVVLAGLALAACTSGESSAPRGDAPRAAAAPRPDAGPPAPLAGSAGREALPVRRGPAIAVTWEALARERYLVENSRFKRRGPTPPQKITLLSESHPEAEQARTPRTAADRAKYVNTAVLSDADMLGLLKGLERSGFYRHANPGYGAPALLENENARGRVTADRDGDARTLVSFRGQGLEAASKEVPRIYSEAKQAIMVMRNMTPTLNVQHFGADPLRR